MTKQVTKSPHHQKMVRERWFRVRNLTREGKKEREEQGHYVPILDSDEEAREFYSKYPKTPFYIINND